MRTVISASRRSDIPAFYMRWLEYRAAKGFVDVSNPVMKYRKYRVSLLPQDVHSIVLWSKDFGPFLKSPLSKSESYNWYFNFSLVDCPEWELNVPPLPKRLEQVKEICQRWSQKHINWRFDPIVFWDDGKKSNVDSFWKICDFMADSGVTRCTFSFVTWYNKVKKRASVQQLNYWDPPYEQKIETLERMATCARDRNITLESCCDDSLLTVGGIIRGSCVNGALLTDLTGERSTFARDTSQRPGCGCTKSADIGSYSMSCPHSCIYCYAKPMIPYMNFGVKQASPLAQG